MPVVFLIVFVVLQCSFSVACTVDWIFHLREGWSAQASLNYPHLFHATVPLVPRFPSRNAWNQPIFRGRAGSVPSKGLRLPAVLVLVLTTMWPYHWPSCTCSFAGWWTARYPGLVRWDWPGSAVLPLRLRRSLSHSGWHSLRSPRTSTSQVSSSPSYPLALSLHWHSALSPAFPSAIPILVFCIPPSTLHFPGVAQWPLACPILLKQLLLDRFSQCPVRTYQWCWWLWWRVLPAWSDRVQRWCWCCCFCCCP